MCCRNAKNTEFEFSSEQSIWLLCCLVCENSFVFLGHCNVISMRCYFCSVAMHILRILLNFPDNNGNKYKFQGKCNEKQRNERESNGRNVLQNVLKVKRQRKPIISKL